MIYIGLVHYPVYNRDLDVITSGITNLDIHDISRSATTYGVKKYYIIHPSERQKLIFDKILNFWKTEVASLFNEHRVQALKIIDFTSDINETIKIIKNQEGIDPRIIATTSKLSSDQVTIDFVKDLIKLNERPILILFGTGNGLHESIFQQADHILKPIQSKADYNYLSVRSAVAIFLDRLLSEE